MRLVRCRRRGRNLFGGKPPKLDEASDSNGNSGQKEKKKKVAREKREILLRPWPQVVLAITAQASRWKVSVFKAGTYLCIYRRSCSWFELPPCSPKQTYAEINGSLLVNGKWRKLDIKYTWKIGVYGCWSTIIILHKLIIHSSSILNHVIYICWYMFKIYLKIHNW